MSCISPKHRGSASPRLQGPLWLAASLGCVCWSLSASASPPARPDSNPSAESRRSADSSAAQPASPLELKSVSLHDASGQPARLAGDGKTPAVYFFLGTECPVANGYIPLVKQLAAEFGKQGVAFLGVHADPTVDPTSARRHQQDFKLDFPVLLDPQQSLTQRLKARVMGEVVVVLDDRVYYQGRIDDKYSPKGKRREKPSTQELRAALDAGLQGRPAPQSIPAFGCPLPKPPADSSR